MNSLKPVLILGVLLAVAYGVYVSIARGPQNTTPPPGAPQAWQDTAPTVQLPGTPTAPPPFPTGTAPGGIGGPAPSFAAPGGLGAPYPSGGAPTNLPVPVLPGGVPTPEGPSAPPLSSSPYGPSAAAQAYCPPPPEDDFRQQFAAMMQQVRMGLDDSQLSDALRALSRLYDHPSMPPAEASQLHDILDQLAGTVVYSPAHLLGPPYTVQPGDTPERIAAQYNVPWLLLARINGIRSPEDLRPGQPLKVVQGPFDALIHLDQFELTLMLQDRYAGRFPIGVGHDLADPAGSYTVREKISNPAYNHNGVVYQAGDPANPYGKLLIDLGGGIGIHGTNDPGNLHVIAGRGAICLSDRDIDDVFGILSDPSGGQIASKVTIRR